MLLPLQIKCSLICSGFLYVFCFIICFCGIIKTARKIKGDKYMCTSAIYKTKDFYFGRTLDYEFSYGDEVTITPRLYPFEFRHMETVKNHYAIIGTAYVLDGYPLYYDAVNEKGLGIAGLNFVGNAHYNDEIKNMDNIAQFEFIPWILCQCASVKETKELLAKINLVNTAFKKGLPPAELHWMIADREECITVEATREGLHIYDNPVGVLTNNPPFKEQMFQLNNYMYLSSEPAENRFSDKLELHASSHGMGALGLPGDCSSQSRFIRAAFTKLNSVSGDTEQESINQFFHILTSVEQPRGCCEVEKGKFEITIYTSCCNADKGIYYYTTYENHQVTAVNMYKENLNSDVLIRYPMLHEEHIKRQN